jgi:hypothetical protein
MIGEISSGSGPAASTPDPVDPFLAAKKYAVRKTSRAWIGDELTRPRVTTIGRL